MRGNKTHARQEKTWKKQDLMSKENKNVENPYIAGGMRLHI